MTYKRTLIENVLDVIGALFDGVWEEHHHHHGMYHGTYHRLPETLVSYEIELVPNDGLPNVKIILKPRRFQSTRRSDTFTFTINRGRTYVLDNDRVFKERLGRALGPYNTFHSGGAKETYTDDEYYSEFLIDAHGNIHTSNVSSSRSRFPSTGIPTGSRSLKSKDYTVSGSQRKLRNGILQMALEDTASSKMVYVKNDPTDIIAPLESWKRLIGQVHPLTRQPLGHSNLRKVKTIGKIIKKRR